MKKIKSISFITLGLASGFLLLSSCKKKDDTTTTPTAQNGTLMFHVHTNADTNEVGAYGDTLVMNGGRKIAVTLAQLYISGIQLVKSDGSVIDGPSVTILKKQEEEQYIIGTVPAGNYKSVRFKVGLSATTNSTTPSASDTLGLFPHSMWFSSSAQPDGFVFVNFQGSVDTTNAATGSNLVPFSYRIGTNAHLISVSMPDENYTITANQATEVHLIADYAKLLNGIQLNNSSNLQVNTSADNAGALAAQIANNIPGVFRYEY